MKRSRQGLIGLLFVAMALVASACGNDDDSTDTTVAAAADTSVATEAPVASDAPADTTATTAAAATDTTAAGATAAAGDGKKVALVYDIGGRGDKSFNDSAAAGYDKAIAEFGLAGKELEPSTGGENRQELLKLAAGEKIPLIYAVGFAFGDAVKAEAAANPDTTFAIVDSAPDPLGANVLPLLFAENEGSYLVGMAAALKSKTGHIGFIGGVEVPLIKKFEAGYVAGAKSIKADITIDIKYLTQPPDFGGFGDPAKGKEAAKGMFDAGADVVYHAAGGSGAGLFEAAVEAGDGKWAIGVDSDQWQTATPEQQAHILTSMLKRVDVAVYETAKDYNAGTLKAGAARVFDLKVDGVGYATSGGFIDDIKDQLEAAKAKIVSGEIKVPSA